MFNFEQQIYEQFRNQQIYDECCGDGLGRRYSLQLNAVTFMHMKGSGQRVLAAFLKHSGWALAFVEQGASKFIVLVWTGTSGGQKLLGEHNG